MLSFNSTSENASRCAHRSFRNRLTSCIKQGERFEVTHQPPLPSVLLQQAVSFLRSDWSLQRSPLAERAKLVPVQIENDAELRKRYERPDAKLDRLFVSTYTHDKAALDCGACDGKQLVSRKERSNPTEPRVFYGMIGSSNTLLKDAKERDQLRAEYPTLRCIEMESAGAAEAAWQSSRRFIFVRGICDYCDTHKNDQWQEYAAAAAAAYVQCLLEMLPGGDIQGKH